MIRCIKKKFTVTRNGRRLVAGNREGELYHLLFMTKFRKFNLAFSDGMPEWPDFQHTIGFSFYRLAQLDDRWHRLEKTYARLILPAVGDRLPRNEYIDYREALVNHRFLRPLAGFGLVETKWEPGEKNPGRAQTIVFFRKTKLLDRLVKFDL